jgi:hypothetical protein
VFFVEQNYLKTPTLRGSWWVSNHVTNHAVSALMSMKQKPLPRIKANKILIYMASLLVQQVV